MAQRIFDPIGIAIPATLYVKLLVQCLWEEKVDWDETFKDDSKSSVHVFCDASCKAYGTAIFIRCEHNGMVKLELLQDKASVITLKGFTVPRLELLAARICTHLAKAFLDNQGWTDVPIDIWTDSTTVIAWIQRQEEWPVFVRNLIKAVGELTKPSDWRHIPGLFNSADLPSRGCFVKRLVESKWWEGPKWLENQEQEWLFSSYSYVKGEIQQKRTVTSITFVNTKIIERNGDIAALRTPVALPSKHPAVKQLVYDLHCKYNPVGAPSFLSLIPEKFWLSTGRQAVQRIIKKCKGSTGDSTRLLHTWWGGFWERLVGFVKQFLRRSSGRAVVMSDELHTIICDCDAQIHSRPITHLSGDNAVPVPLTPFWFLQDIQDVGVPDCDANEACSMTHRIHYRWRLCEELRMRFRSKYLGNLSWAKRRTTRKLVVGEVVIIVSDNLKRLT
ncbi:hypothetical protein PR048_012504 [Dryococelus australis]|uniref:Uncharacterized protein n=1 Tax=Dryococelus australis TaxID=614101 RepID=A0ABQ9HPK4_9NEOP|nr:hypothetical protein PR048_012504 [Dryococelus australis]